MIHHFAFNTFVWCAFNGAFNPKASKSSKKFYKLYSDMGSIAYLTCAGYDLYNSLDHLQDAADLYLYGEEFASAGEKYNAWGSWAFAGLDALGAASHGIGFAFNLGASVIPQIGKKL